jgi:hypothetical protein
VWSDFKMQCWLLRSRFYLTKEEREYEQL